MFPYSTGVLLRRTQGHGTKGVRKVAVAHLELRSGLRRISSRLDPFPAYLREAFPKHDRRCVDVWFPGSTWCLLGSVRSFFEYVIYIGVHIFVFHIHVFLLFSCVFLLYSVFVLFLFLHRVVLCHIRFHFKIASHLYHRYHIVNCFNESFIV